MIIYKMNILRHTLINTKPLCKDCKYFIPNYKHCGKFGETNLITGEVSYEYARIARNNSGKCKEDAIHFEQNKYKYITKPYYFCLDNYYYFLFAITTTTYITGMIYITVSKSS